MALDKTILADAIKASLPQEIIDNITAVVEAPGWVDTPPENMKAIIWAAIAEAIGDVIAEKVVAHIQDYGQIEIKAVTDAGLQTYTVPPASPVPTTGPVAPIILPVGGVPPFPTGTGVIK